MNSRYGHPRSPHALAACCCLVVLPNREVWAGAHGVAFDAGALAAGLYFVSLDAGGAVRTQRLTLLR